MRVADSDVFTCLGVALATVLSLDVKVAAPVEASPMLQSPK